MAREDGRAEHSGLTEANFANLFRVIDAATTSQDAASPSTKRKRASHATSNDDASRPRTMGIAEWAKARADLHLDKKRNIEAAQRRMPVVPASPSPSPSTSTLASTSYAPFSKAKLLSRIGTFTLSTFNVRTAAPRDLVPAIIQSAEQRKALEGSISVLTRWLEPLGPALHGWQHLAPHQLVTRRSQSGKSHEQERGAKNKIYCPTCGATHTFPVTPVSSLAELFDQIHHLSTAHETWCPWRRRSCDQRLYHIGGESGSGHRNLVIGAPSKYKARKRCLETVREIEVAMGDASIEVVGLPDEEQGDIDAVVQALAALAPNEHLPNRSAVILAILGWEADPGGKFISCGMCARRVNLGVATGTKMINAVREHRSFSPWVQAEVQAGCYLPALPLMGDGDGDGEAALVQRLQAVSAGGAQTSHPGWRLTLNKLLDHKQRTAATTGEVDVSIDGDEEGGATTVDTAASTTSSLTKSSARGQKTSDILRTARNMLFGGGSGSDSGIGGRKA
ncbi:hypothetical protein BDZ90DRAFT_231181 [Jaminaea rosea]|uniref:NuBaID C-terminal domain-containing protein n=1 Tax=Jaminaea rosea TaxID=1569628 RepID=A0A316UW14_9BASI|nr:hypothetical protein BDZ90DRAFT_231181 [Jaminaea rosea]PWN29194.1 hypothetical protein BDZ90DRAFT_231181 [Jaminaea rosea]